MTHNQKPEQVGRNLYKSDDKYFRLFATGETPNGCWLVNPIMIQLLDIEAATGNDVYGEDIITFDITGVIASGSEFIKFIN